MLQTSTPALTSPTDEDIVANLIASHGDVELACERLFGPSEAPSRKMEVLLRFPHLPIAAIRQGIQAALTFQMFQTVTEVKTSLISNLQDLTPALQARLLNDLITHLTGLSADPSVQGAANSPVNILNVMAGEGDHAKLQLANMMERLGNGNSDNHSGYTQPVVVATASRPIEAN